MVIYSFLFTIIFLFILSILELKVYDYYKLLNIKLSENLLKNE